MSDQAAQVSLRKACLRKETLRRNPIWLPIYVCKRGECVCVCVFDRKKSLQVRQRG